MSLSSEQYAFLAHAIYRPFVPQGSLKSNTRSYKVLYVSDPSATHYRGAVVQDQSGTELIVVNKGTDPSNIHDITADVGMGMMGAPTQWPEAAALLREALDHANKYGIPKDHISITGHSLGGALAQLQAAMPEAEGIHAETFNTYGAESMARGLGLDVESAQQRVINHRMYHDPVSALARPIGRTVDYMDHADYQRHKQGGLSPVGEAGAMAAAHGIGNFWNADRNEPGDVFAHNYAPDLLRRPLDDLPRGVPLDLAIPWHMLGHEDTRTMPPLAAHASTDEMFDHLCKAMEKDEHTFMQALGQIGQTDASRAFHAQAAQQVDTEDRAMALDAQVQQMQQAQQEQLAQVQGQQARGPVMTL